MVIFFFLFFLPFLEDLGFLVLFSFLFLYTLIIFYRGLRLRINLTFDFIRFGIFILCLLVFIRMIFAGYYEIYSFNGWKIVLLFLFILLFILFFSFSFSSFLIFYLFFEFVIIPTFILIIGWGYRANRVQASLYIFLYTFLSSLPLLVLLIFIFLDGVRLFFFYNLFVENFKSFFYYWWIFLLVVFIVKLPLFFLHLWLPKAHVDAPLLGSMILAGVLLKIGGYGIYKSITYLYLNINSFSWFYSSFSLWGSLLISFLCIRQLDAKRLIAYSSVVHIGPLFCCLFLTFYSGLLGSYWIILSHGFCSACLFFLVNEVYLILGRRNIFFLRGGLFFAPFFSIVWFFFCLSNIGFPPSFNFFSEIAIMSGVFSYRFFLFYLFFFLLCLRGFYRIILYCFFNHGFEKIFMENLNNFNLKNFIVIFIFWVLLIFFFVFIPDFC